MTKKSKLQKILQAITPDKTDIDFSIFDQQIADLKSKLKEKVQTQTLDDVNNQLDKFRKKIDLSPLLASLKELQDAFEKKKEELDAELENKSNELTNLLNDKDTSNNEQINQLKAEIETIKNNIAELQKSQEDRITPIIEGMTNLEKRLNKSIGQQNENLLNEITSAKSSGTKSLNKEVQNLIDQIELLRQDIFRRLANMGHGGNANRQIRIGGVDYLTRYTDINLKAGTNMSITVANDDVKRSVDITFTASGGGGINFETPTGAIDDSNTTFTVTHEPKLLNINGAVYSVGTGLYTSYLAGTITLSAVVGVGGFIISVY